MTNFGEPTLKAAGSFIVNGTRIVAGTACDEVKRLQSSIKADTAHSAREWDIASNEQLENCDSTQHSRSF